MAKRFNKYQIDALVAAFEESEHLTKQKKIELGSATGLDVEQIASWFNRKRAQKRARESVGDLDRTNAELQQALQESEEREAELQKELRESKRREAELGAENQHLRQQLGMVGGDSQFDPVLRFFNGYA
ncbi:hypothetical protein Pfo_011013 [Paulownia fortunei]|nr:hypothetical protein Pfo_011013 [Paulownia fortunei]